jgi:hypothetical protein
VTRVTRRTGFRPLAHERERLPGSSNEGIRVLVVRVRRCCEQSSEFADRSDRAVVVAGARDHVEGRAPRLYIGLKNSATCSGVPYGE